MGFLKTIKNALLDIIFPENCLSCGKQGDYLCKDCLHLSPSAERQTLEWIYPIYDYRHPAIKKSIAFLKYKGRKNIVDLFSDALHTRILEELADLKMMENFSDPLLVPIPLAPKRYKERGFNQSEVLSRRIAFIDKEDNFKLLIGALVKPKDTLHQAKIKDRRERLTNLAGSFSIKNQEKIIGRNIILLDDVATTGATLAEARKVLKSAGAKKIIAFTIAH